MFPNELRRTGRSRTSVAALALLWVGSQADASEANLKVELPPNVPDLTSVYAWQGSVWLGTKKGLYRYRIDTSQWTQVSSNQPITIVNCFLEEEDGKGLWIGAKEGLFRVKPPENQAVRELNVERPVLCLATSPGVVWVGTGRGLHRWHGQSRPRIPFYAKDDPNNPSTVEVNCLLRNGTDLWVGTDRGLFRMDLDHLGAAPAQPVPGNVTAIYPGGPDPLRDSFWYATGDEAEKKSDPGKVEVLGRPEAVVFGTAAGHVKRFAASATGLWLAGEKGLFQIRRCEAKLRDTEVVEVEVDGRVVDLSCSGDTLWVVTPKFLYAINGMRGGKWDPGIRPTQERYPLRFTEDPLDLRWEMTDYRGRTTPKLIRSTLRVLEDGVRELAGSGNARPVGDRVFEINVKGLSCGFHTLSIEAEDLHGIRAEVAVVQREVTARDRLMANVYGAPAENAVVRVFAIPFPIYVVSIVVAVLAAMSAVALVLAPLAVKAYWRVLAWSGWAAWWFNTSEAIEVTKLTVVDCRHEEQEWTVRREIDAAETLVRAPLINSQGNRSFPNDFQTRGTEKTVLIRVSREHFHQPWAQSIGDDLYGTGQRTVAGQQALCSPLPVPSARPITFAGLACLCPCQTCPGQRPLPEFKELRNTAESKKFRRLLEWDSRWRIWMRLWRGLSRGVWRPRTLCDLIAERFQVWGASILWLPDEARVSARAEDFIVALRLADIVHVVAHGEERLLNGGEKLHGLCFQNRFVTAKDLRSPGVLENLRCRLLVLTVCNGGALNARDDSLVFPLVERGVQVVAPPVTLNYPPAIEFFSKFYETLFPRPWAQDYTLVEALRAGGAACVPKGGSDIRKFADRGTSTITLYGHPATTLRFTLTPPPWWAWARQWWARARQLLFGRFDTKGG